MKSTLRNVLLVTGLTLGSLSYAQTTCQPEQAKIEIAKANVKVAQEFYDKGKFAEAIPLYQEAQKISCLGILLYNIAQAYRRLAETQEANREANYQTSLSFYKRFLAESPTTEYPKQRTEAEQRIIELNNIFITATKSKPDPKPDPTPILSQDPTPTTIATTKIEPPKEEPPSLPMPLKATIGVTSVGLVAWGYTGFLMTQRGNQPDEEAAARLTTKGRIASTTGDILVIGGGVASAVLFMQYRKERKQSQKVSVSASTSHIAFSLSF
jgi:tetratricopeptide (TPR) repeat protein